MQYVILGTAGHIDHGKSALVKALTGIDPDRLKEEKERGITIDLGFADLTYPDGLTVGIVDVPGHERLVKNMLAGAGGIDLVLLVIAVDEGIMPQSREHLHICNLLKIKSGLVAITKADLVDKDWLELVEDEVRNFVKGTFLDGADIVPVSSKTLFNIDLLKEKIKEVALRVEPKSTKGLFRLPIDRVFTLKGFGTVVTGTAISGSISANDDVEILPSKMKSRVRGLHSHGKTIQTAYAGQRVAINLQGVDKEELKYKTLKTTILEILKSARYQPPFKEELAHLLRIDQKHLSDVLKFMVKEGSLVKINDSIYLSSSAYHTMIEKLKEFFSRKSEMSLREFKDIFNTTRKYPIPLLEYLDSQKITKRIGDIRKFLLEG